MEGVRIALVTLYVELYHSSVLLSVCCYLSLGSFDIYAVNEVECYTKPPVSMTSRLIRNSRELTNVLRHF